MVGCYRWYSAGTSGEDMMANDILRTVRELLESSDCVLMGNAVNTEGKLYEDSVANLTAILAMLDKREIDG